jgi:PAS domain S-box-containing protein
MERSKMENVKASKSKEAMIENLEKEIKRLKDKEHKYRHLFEKSPIMIYATDRKGLFINVNQAGIKMMGYDSADQIIGKKFQDFFFKDPDDFESYKEIIQRLGVVLDFETQMKQRNGNVLSVNLTGAVRASVTSKLKGYEGFVTNISDRVKTERRLKESEGKYRAILDNSLAAIYMFQDGGYFSFVNKRLIHLLGYETEDEILGRKFWEFVTPEDRELVKKRGLTREKAEIQPRQYPFRMVKKDGSILWVDMRSSHASYMGIPAAVGNFIDISKEKKAQEEIQMLSRKLIEGIEEERRSLASDLHDEFGQELTLLQFDMEFLQNTIPANLDEPNEACNKIMDHIQRLAEKIRNTTSRLRPDLLDHLGLIPTLEWYIQNFNSRIKDISINFQAVGFKRRLSPEVEIVIYRIFQEGLNNITKHSEADKVDIKLTSSHPGVIYTMQDNGKGFEQKNNGMPVEGLSKGIGLLSMKERVASLKGTIEIKSVLNKGTSIWVELPMRQKSHQ